MYGETILDEKDRSLFLRSYNPAHAVLEFSEVRGITERRYTTIIDLSRDEARKLALALFKATRPKP